MLRGTKSIIKPSLVKHVLYVIKLYKCLLFKKYKILSLLMPIIGSCVFCYGKMQVLGEAGGLLSVEGFH